MLHTICSLIWFIDVSSIYGRIVVPMKMRGFIFEVNLRKIKGKIGRPFILLMLVGTVNVGDELGQQHLALVTIITSSTSFYSNCSLYFESNISRFFDSKKDVYRLDYNMENAILLTFKKFAFYPIVVNDFEGMCWFFENFLNFDRNQKFDIFWKICSKFGKNWPQLVKL